MAESIAASVAKIRACWQQVRQTAAGCPKGEPAVRRRVSQLPLRNQACKTNGASASTAISG